MGARVKNCILTFTVIVVMMTSVILAQKYAYLVEKKTSSRAYQHLTVAEPDPATSRPGEFHTKLPIVSIETGGLSIPGEVIVDRAGAEIGYTETEEGESTRVVTARIFDEAEAYNHLTDEPAEAGSVRIRYRGNSSRYFDKKSYKLNFVTEDGLERKVNVMGMGAHDEWALYGPFLDKTLVRNYIFLNLYGEMDGYTPDVRYCELFLDGTYQGLYVMMETVSVGRTRTNLTVSSTRPDKTSYIMRLDKPPEIRQKIQVFTSYTMNLEPKSTISVIYPGGAKQTDEFRRYIARDVSRFEKALYSYDFCDAEKGYRAYVNVDSFVTYYLMSEFLAINDMCSRSTYLYKDLGGKINIGPGWDFNNAADNFFNEVDGTDGTGFLYHDRTWFKMLLKDKYFVEKVIDSYREMRYGGILDEGRILTLIDDTVLFLGDAIDRNYKVWGYSFDPSQLNSHNKLRPQERNPISYAEALSQLKRYIIRRGAWLDENIESLRQYCDPARIKPYLD